MQKEKEKKKEMNIKVPKNIESPTVIILGQQKADDKKNAFSEKRMDLLERKLDQQYKAFIDKTDNTKQIDELSKSFMAILDRFMQMNKSMITSMHQDKMNNLRREFNRKLKELERDNNKDEILKSFVSKLSKFESSINKISRPVTVVSNVKPTVSRDYLSKSFNNFYLNMQKLIQDMRPRMIPSPS